MKKLLLFIALSFATISLATKDEAKEHIAISFRTAGKTRNWANDFVNGPAGILGSLKLLAHWISTGRNVYQPLANDYVITQHMKSAFEASTSEIQQAFSNYLQTELGWTWDQFLAGKK